MTGKYALSLRSPHVTKRRSLRPQRLSNQHRTSARTCTAMTVTAAAAISLAAAVAPGLARYEQDICVCLVGG